MSNSVRKQPIHVGILEISSQNKAILEYFFSDAGKSYFKEVSLEKASAYIIDYDSLGAKESWSSTFDETKKPGIIISIKEVDLPSTIWLKKPLTVKALKDAGESIREMILNEAEKEVTATVDEVEIKEVAEEAADKEIEIIQETSEEKNQDDKYLLDDLLIDKIVDIPSEPISEILFNEEPLETISTKSQDDSIDAIDIIDISKSSVKEEQIADYIEESVLEETVANTEEAALITRPEETLQLDNLLIDEFLEVPKEDLIDTTDAELTFGVEIDETLSLAEQKEPELALAEIDTSVSVSASSTD
ncbi:MAG: hypothetical protein L3J46_06510, partial [Kangiellaceae bacterium]|nr:hypothetical protein [Kangiellaceae bacterium]